MIDKMREFQENLEDRTKTYQDLFYSYVKNKNVDTSKMKEF